MCIYIYNYIYIYACVCVCMNIHICLHPYMHTWYYYLCCLCSIMYAIALFIAQHDTKVKSPGSAVQVDPVRSPCWVAGRNHRCRQSVGCAGIAQGWPGSRGMARAGERKTSTPQKIGNTGSEFQQTFSLGGLLIGSKFWSRQWRWVCIESIEHTKSIFKPRELA